MRFKERVAIVTGGNSGIGKEVARRFVAEGGLVVVNGRNAAKTEAAVKEIDAFGTRAVAHVGDIAQPSTAQAAVKMALDRFGRVDVLFNNAGIFGPKPFLDVDEAEYDRFVDIILKGKFFAAQAAAKAMKAAGRGRRHRSNRVHVGAPGDRCDAIGGVLGCESRCPRVDQKSGNRTGAGQYPRQRDRAGRDRDAGVQHVPNARTGGEGAPDL
jgi:NAD(P)-dependent dehydrogenase (short-subunit alcohol dehydrogenase family)